MSEDGPAKPIILTKDDIAPRTGAAYPAPFDKGFDKRLKHALTNALGLTQFGVNIVTLEPGGQSSLRHWHEVEDEFAYILEGELTLITDIGETLLTQGMATAFPAGKADGHHLINKSLRNATYLEVGTRAAQERAHYPDIDLKVEKNSKGAWVFSKKDGTLYE